jgi:hypothetical protein
MAEATHQQITTPLPGEEPFIGDLDEGEICINVADGRIWSGDSIGTPVELGGAVKNHPMGPLLTSNYLDVDITSADNLPVANTNPLDIPVGFHRSHRILLRFTQIPLENFQTYFDYPVNWGVESSWKFGTSVITWGGDVNQLDFTATNPVDFYKAQGRRILIELSSFGPSTEWIGRLLWVSSISTPQD